MKCAKCPLFHSWNNENDRGECCGLFGDSWDNQLQYEDKEGTIIGCYVDSNYIARVDRKYTEYLEKEANAWAEAWLDVEPPKGEENAE